ncbi:D-inositol-3-phosphate glycosyltransferase [Sporomusa rhizae]|uniref:glycosyltransferase n=1 Tax=Sporomusa rhizae TaxID=357999 RepID=UPI00352AF01A
MKIALLCTQDNGGAGRAALRLHKGLNQIGEDSTFYVKRKTTDSYNVVEMRPAEYFEQTLKYLQKCFSNTYEGNTICSAMYPGLGVRNLERLQNFDVINLHWIPGLVSLEDIPTMHAMGKPVVWTLHDQNPMTGACHYTHGCEKYKFDCSDCPQLKDNLLDVPKAIIKAKIRDWPKDIVVVTPSRWLANCAKESAVFKKHRIEVIPYSLETDIFKPVTNNEVKTSLEIPENAKVILFGANSFAEKRKGLPELIEAVKHLQTDSRVQQLLAANQLYIVSFGYPAPPLDSIGIPYKTVGYTIQEEMLVRLYSTADVVALPSLEDNLPNIMLESMACGTPVVAFATGGMKDTIKRGKNGFLVPLRNTKTFAKRLIDGINGGHLREYCRKFIEEKYRLDIQAKKYRELFQDLVKAKDA